MNCYQIFYKLIILKLISQVHVYFHFKYTFLHSCFSISISNIYLNSTIQIFIYFQILCTTFRVSNFPSILNWIPTITLIRCLKLVRWCFFVSARYLYRSEDNSINSSRTNYSSIFLAACTYVHSYTWLAIKRQRYGFRLY